MWVRWYAFYLMNCCHIPLPLGRHSPLSPSLASSSLYPVIPLWNIIPWMLRVEDFSILVSIHPQNHFFRRQLNLRYFSHFSIDCLIKPTFWVKWPCNITVRVQISITLLFRVHYSEILQLLGPSQPDYTGLWIRIFQNNSFPLKIIRLKFLFSILNHGLHIFGEVFGLIWHASTYSLYLSELYKTRGMLTIIVNSTSTDVYMSIYGNLIVASWFRIIILESWFWFLRQESDFTFRNRIDSEILIHKQNL